MMIDEQKRLNRLNELNGLNRLSELSKLFDGVTFSNSDITAVVIAGLTDFLTMVKENTYYAVEFFGGSGSFGRALVDIMRLKSVLVRILMLDIVAESAARQKFPMLVPYLDDGSITYYQIDLNQFDNSVLVALLAYFLDDATLSCISWIHASVECSTYSWAGMSVVTHRTIEGAAVSATAVHHTKMLRSMVRLAERYVQATPTGLFTFESPRHGSFKSQTDIQGLLASEGWMLFVTNYCAAACPFLDGMVYEKDGGLSGAVWPSKTTVIVAYGLGDKGELPQCLGSDCRMMVPGQTYHAKVICSTSQGFKPQQSRVKSEDKSMIPKGLFQAILNKHEEYKKQCDGSAFYCFKCGDGGEELLVCDTDGCPRVQHAGCDKIMSTEFDDWYCDICCMTYQLDLSGG